jgi:uncharacterized membrane-anchored protein YhcB (DUF1043 family)
VLAQITETMRALDHAAAQDMRWWFLGLLMTVGLAVGWVARYFGRRHDRLSDRLDRVQDEHTEYLQEQGDKMAGALRDNASAFRQFGAAIESFNKHLIKP